MSHQFETGFFVREPAWHRLGTVVQEAPSMTEAIELAGLDWTVEEAPLFADLADGSGSLSEVRSHKALVRSTDKSVLSIVGPRYRPLQNADAFSFFDPFLADGSAELETAGSLAEGRRVWVLARITGAVAEVAKGDEVKGFLLLYHGHDGKLCVTVFFTPIRVVCWNTATYALGEAERDGSIVRLRHTSGLPAALKLVQKCVSTSKRTFEVTLETYREMLRKDLSIDGLKQYVRKVWDVPAAEDRLPRAFEEIEMLVETGAGSDLPGVRGSLWGAYNAVTEYTDHRYGKDESRRLNAAWFGTGRQRKQRAFDEAVALLKA